MIWSTITSHHYKVTEVKQLYFHLADRISSKISSSLNKVLYFKVKTNAHTYNYMSFLQIQSTGKFP